MQAIDLVIRSKPSMTARARQARSMFDVPEETEQILRWKGTLPLDERPWNVGLIVGPSGCGKSSIMKHVWGEPTEFEWNGASVIDDVSDVPLSEVTEAFSSVGFNTIPAWLRPYGVLSNGERFRVDLARRLLTGGDPIVVDEFSSVVDRQVAQIGGHAVQKFVRKKGKKFVAVGCHYDVIDWLQPDWILEPTTMQFRWRSLQRRPNIDIEIARVDYSAWHMFAPFHYLTADLHKAAACYVLFANGSPAAFAGILHRPHATAQGIKGVSRLVTVPDWQGLGLAFVLVDALGAAFDAVGNRLMTYPAHPALISAFDRSKKWALKKRPGTFNPSASKYGDTLWGGRPCAVFEYCGEAMKNKSEAMRLIAG